MKVGLILCKCFITYPNSVVSVLISFVFASWIINEVEILVEKLVISLLSFYLIN